MSFHQSVLGPIIMGAIIQTQELSPIILYGYRLTHKLHLNIKVLLFFRFPNLKFDIQLQLWMDFLIVIIQMVILMSPIGCLTQ